MIGIRSAPWFCLLAVLCGSGVSQAENDSSRSPPAATVGDCVEWTGTARGNDSDVRITANLCATGDDVHGYVRWESNTSGSNVREVDGRWSRNHRILTLRDVRIVRHHAALGWRFCLIDRYELTALSPGRLEGTYDSAACRDHATVSLERR